MNKIQRVQAYQYDGTIDSCNNMIDNLGLDNENHHILNFNERFETTNKFTGLIGIHCFKRFHPRFEGLILRPGDYYYVDLPDENLND